MIASFRENLDSDRKFFVSVTVIEFNLEHRINSCVFNDLARERLDRSLTVTVAFFNQSLSSP